MGCGGGRKGDLFVITHPCVLNVTAICSTRANLGFSLGFVDVVKVWILQEFPHRKSNVDEDVWVSTEKIPINAAYDPKP